MQPILISAERMSRVLGIMVSVTLAWAVGGKAWASPPIVDLLASPGSRLADDLRRELGASGFLVVLVESTSTTDWEAEVHRLAGQPPIHGVVVRADERLMIVFTRNGPAEPLVKHLEQSVEPKDRLARRRACLGVVEYLRVLSENDPPQTSVDLGGSSLPPPPSRTAPPSASAAPSEGATGQTSSSPVASKAATPALVADGASAGDASAAVERRSIHAWEVGAGSTLDLQAAPGGPTVHLQFLWYLPLEWRLALCVRGIWPVLGGEFRSEGSDVRVWTFGGAVSLQYLFNTGSARLRPYLGTAFGTRVALTETAAMNALQSRETFTPSLTLGAEMGIRYGFSSLVQLFLELGVDHGWLVPGIHRAAHEQQAANSESIRAGFGVLFKI